SGREERELQKRLRSLERKIAKLDKDAKGVDQQLAAVADAGEAQRLHRERARLAAEIEALEHRWLETSHELESA
ncbi:MAG: ABC transporter ATP-binding protein, partial [Planctomycetota bacterium]